MLYLKLKSCLGLDFTWKTLFFSQRQSTVENSLKPSWYHSWMFPFSPSTRVMLHPTRQCFESRPWDLNWEVPSRTFENSIKLARNSSECPNTDQARGSSIVISIVSEFWRCTAQAVWKSLLLCAGTHSSPGQGGRSRGRTPNRHWAQSFDSSFSSGKLMPCWFAESNQRCLRKEENNTILSVHLFDYSGSLRF